MSKKLSYKNAVRRASFILRDKKLSNKLIRNASETLQSKAKVSKKVRATRKVFADFIRLIKSYVNGSYRDISWKNMLYITAVIIYFITPTDLIPDFIPVSGLLDDASLALWTYDRLQSELNEFLLWERKSKTNNKEIIDENQ
ncbi:hypothetical protein GCM10027429_11650 [Marivirga atlantica]|uniref:DUF1232 domain-containing protein n=1 Tax=Marivirga atlantica TaxID=1548457 RepID=A0A937DGH0_9BACT|nr:YkvA family protein [Marivirga atlantica]MBL0764778.1 DUF1232 domain-containing protein [Marivirga atlantica]